MYVGKDVDGRSRCRRRICELLERFAGLSIAGGATYDGIVAATAAHHGCSLISCDCRAAKAYDRLGVQVTYL